ncbi:galactokinase [Natronoglomus mannanivorans]|uniref:Galactokinase n=1 Tax=Natronoglomus mannanivorans TaxID=2979990 RepID=A0AAP3E1P5_9EURY|nr:galactokinase [Halobacteria archaeon AArc-xg1-1]
MSEHIRRAEQALIDQFGDSDEEIGIASAPGRVNLIGGHTDYNEGFVLPAAIDRRTVIVGRPRDDDVVNLYSLSLDEQRSISLEDRDRDGETNWSDYVIGVFDRLVERGYEPGGMDLAIAGNVPIGAGVSSSAALEVAAATAIDSIAGLGLPKEEIAKTAWEAETQFVGVGCGIMDQFAATFSEADSALFLDCRSETFDLVPVDSERARILVVDTGVQHDLVEDGHNERVRQCQEGVEAFDRLADESISSLRDVSTELFDEYADDLPETIRKRCRHVLAENERVKEAAEALESGDLETVGALMCASHESLRDDYETSCDELDLVVELATEHDGVLGARMTGSGFGGSVVSLVDPDAVDDVEETIRTAYRSETGIDPEIYVCEPAAGATEVPLEADIDVRSD